MNQDNKRLVMELVARFDFRERMLQLLGDYTYLKVYVLKIWKRDAGIIAPHLVCDSSSEDEFTDIYRGWVDQYRGRTA